MWLLNRRLFILDYFLWCTIWNILITRRSYWSYNFMLKMFYYHHWRRICDRELCSSLKLFIVSSISYLRFDEPRFASCDSFWGFKKWLHNYSLLFFIFGLLFLDYICHLNLFLYCLWNGQTRTCILCIVYICMWYQLSRRCCLSIWKVPSMLRIHRGYSNTLQTLVRPVLFLIFIYPCSVLLQPLHQLLIVYVLLALLIM